MSLSLVNEAQYLMINRGSVQLIQELMSSRFKHPESLLKTLQEMTSRCLYIYNVFWDLWKSSM